MFDVSGRIGNQSGVYNARYAGKYLITHVNPVSGAVWAENRVVTDSDGNKVVGAWMYLKGKEKK